MSELTISRVTLRPGSAEGPALLELKDLAVSVGIRRVLEGVNLVLREGEAIRITGPNGSGKSSLLNAIAGLAPALVRSGTITLHGRDITAAPAHERARNGLAFMRQRDNVFPKLTIKENLEVALGRGAYSKFEQAYPGWAGALPPRKRADFLSGGQRQRLAWAMAALRPWRVLLADEPEAGLSEPLPLPPNGSYIVVSHHEA